MMKFWIYIWGAIIAWYPISTRGFLNILINHREVMKLMGLEADLFYVHEGTINTYAMHFTVPVPADVHELEFSWQSLTAYPLPYSITLDFDVRQDALALPTLSIPAEGFVPHQIESFFVYLRCTGNATAQIPLSINLLVRGPPLANDTNLHFKRVKSCLKGEFPPQNQSTSTTPAPELPESSGLFNVIAGGMGLVVMLTLVAIGMCLRAKKHMRRGPMHFTTTTYGSHQNVFNRLDPAGRPPSASGSYATITSLNKYPTENRKCGNIFDKLRISETTAYATTLLPTDSQIGGTLNCSKQESICDSGIFYYASSQVTQTGDTSTPKRKLNDKSNISISSESSSGTGSINNAKFVIDYKKKFYDLLNVQPGIFEFRRLIAEGNFGRIFIGKIGESCDLLIKTVVEGSSLMQAARLLEDASLLIGVSHQNVLAPMLANSEFPGTPEIAYPLPSKENLKIFLQKCRKMNCPLSIRQIATMSFYATNGLSHLHSLGMIHKDIAARNCYIDEDFNLRICDSALSRDIFPRDYLRLNDNESRPLRWMSLETLQKDSFTTYSDVWMLGVLFWELATFAQMPYENIDIAALTRCLADGFRLARPVKCPSEFFKVMCYCWHEEPSQRPPLPQLSNYLQSFCESLEDFSQE